MKFWNAVTDLPQPLKGALRFFMTALALTFFAIIFVVVFRSDWSVVFMRLAFGLMAGAALVIGLTLATDFRGSARSYSGMMKSYKPLGVDYGQSPFIRPLPIRLFGVGYILVGVWFTVFAFMFTPKL